MQVKRYVKLPIGTKVRVRPDLNSSRRYNGNGVNDGMMIMRGKIVTISNNHGWNNYGYEIEESSANWTYDMLEYIEKEDAFEMLLHGQINESEYQELATEGTL